MKNNRRNIIKKAAMGFTGISIVPRHVLGNGFKAPSDIFNLGIIGTGAQARGLGKRFTKMKESRIIAACDVHKLKLNQFRKTIKELDSNNKLELTTYLNYKDLIERKDIDGVINLPPIIGMQFNQ